MTAPRTLLLLFFVTAALNSPSTGVRADSVAHTAGGNERGWLRSTAERPVASATITAAIGGRILKAGSTSKAAAADDDTSPDDDNVPTTSAYATAATAVDDDKVPTNAIHSTAATAEDDDNAPTTATNSTDSTGEDDDSNTSTATGSTASTGDDDEGYVFQNKTSNKDYAAPNDSDPPADAKTAFVEDMARRSSNLGLPEKEGIVGIGYFVLIALGIGTMIMAKQARRMMRKVSYRQIAEDFE